MCRPELPVSRDQLRDVVVCVAEQRVSVRDGVCHGA
jgi:hypothetical protein